VEPVEPEPPAEEEPEEPDPDLAPPLDPEPLPEPEPALPETPSRFNSHPTRLELLDEVPELAGATESLETVELCVTRAVGM
jgi:hypothetical protein